MGRKAKWPRKCGARECENVVEAGPRYVCDACAPRYERLRNDLATGADYSVVKRTRASPMPCSVENCVRPANIRSEFCVVHEELG